MNPVKHPFFSAPYRREQTSSNRFFNVYFWTSVAIVAIVLWNKVRKISFPVWGEVLLTAAAACYVAYVVLFGGEDGEFEEEPVLPDFHMPDSFSAGPQEDPPAV